MNETLDIEFDKITLELTDKKNKSDNEEDKYLNSNNILKIHTSIGMFYSKIFMISNEKVKIVPCNINGENLSYDSLFNILSIKNEK